MNKDVVSRVQRFMDGLDDQINQAMLDANWNQERRLKTFKAGAVAMLAAVVTDDTRSPSSGNRP